MVFNQVTIVFDGRECFLEPRIELFFSDPWLLSCDGCALPWLPARAVGTALPWPIARAVTSAFPWLIARSASRTVPRVSP